jgi:hypothetical protein
MSVQNWYRFYRPTMYNRRVVCCVAKIYDLSVFLNKRSIGKKLRIALERKINFQGLYVKAIFWKLKQNRWMHQSIWSFIKKKLQDVRRELKKNRQRHVTYEENGDFLNI